VFFDGDGRQLQGLPGKAVTQKIKTMLDLADEGFVGVLCSLDAALAESRVLAAGLIRATAANKSGLACGSSIPLR